MHCFISTFERVCYSVLSSGRSAARVGEPSRWRMAVQEHMSRSLVPPLAKTPAFENMGSLHAALAEHVFDYCQDLPAKQLDRIVYIDIGQDLLAACCLQTQCVQLRQHSVARYVSSSSPDLRCRLMPASASLIDDWARQDLVELTLPTLMWHWGQYKPSAAEHMPDFGEQVIHVRGFPNLPPHALQLRQLELIHRLSHEPMNFELLEHETPESERLHLCADLTCLYATGVLQLRAPWMS